MKRRLKSILSITLVLIMVFSVMPFSGLITAQATEIWQQPRGTIITYGSYPQTKVTDSSLISALNAKSKSWVSYGYYTGSGSWDDGQMKSSNYMKYADISYNGEKYRAVTFTQYRPDRTGFTSSASYTNQDENGYTPNNVYYFKYEPLRWRILDPEEGLVMCKNIIDSQAYNNYDLYANGEHWGDSAMTHYASNWAKCSLRQWLNDDFYNTAFSSSEKNAIKTSYLENKSTDSSSYDAPSTYDKVFLLSNWDMFNNNYGFSSSSRRAQGTDYAKCQGLRVSTSSSYYGNSWWLLRSPYDSEYTRGVYPDGYVYAYLYHPTGATEFGIRPALKFNPKSSIPGYTDVSASVPWKEGSRGIGTTTLNLNSDMFSKASTEYNHGLAQLSSQLVTLGYANNDYKDNEEKYKNASEDEIKKAKRHSDYLENALSKLGMSDIEMNVSTGRDQENYFLANRTVDVYGTEYTFVVAGLIGSHGKQWDSNFDPQGKDSSKTHSDYVKENYHTGFYDAKEYVKGKLKTYLDDLYDRNHISKENVKILVCGHSRGAAASNLLAADLIDSQNYALADNIYTYVFATPNSATLKVARKPQYDRIVNFINPEDFVTKVLPTQWGYTRFGKSYVLPSKDNEGKKYASYLSNMLNEYNILSPNEGYTSYLSEKSVNDPVSKMASAFDTHNPKVAMDCYYNKRGISLRLMTWSFYDYFQTIICPFVNGDGIGDQLLAVNGILNVPGTSVFASMTKFFLFTSSTTNGLNPSLSQKFADAHCAQTYCAYLLSMSEAQATKDRNSKRATINCPVDVEVYDKETGELVGRIVNNVVDEDIAAKENAVNMYVEGDQKEFWLPSDGNYEVKLIGNDSGFMDYSVAEIDENAAETAVVNFFDVPVIKDYTVVCNMDSDKEIEEYVIESEDGSNMLQPTQAMSGDEIISYNINVTTEGDGYATNSMTVTSGDRVTLEATPEEGASFLGWYENGAKISTETELSFVAKSDRNITAKFSEKALPSVKSVSISDISLDYKSSATIKPTIKADEGASFTVTYSSSNTSVATVDNNGKVTSVKQFGLNRGSTVITCTVTDSNGNIVTDTCTVTVNFTVFQWIIKIVLFGWLWY